MSWGWESGGPHDGGSSPKTGARDEGRAAAPLRLLLIEDDPLFARSLQRAADSFDLVWLPSAEEALQRIEEERFDAVLLDLDLGPARMNGFEFLERSARQCPWIPVMLLTVVTHADDVLRAMSLGACGYAHKDLSYEEILERIESLLDRHRLGLRARDLEDRLRGEHPFLSLDDPLIQKVETLMAQVAPYDTTVLVTGESGTGKSVLAREIHLRSRRREGPFRTFECGAVAAALMASELFGSVRGAFTGAENREGVAEAASGGTLFVDEIDKLDVTLQQSLLGLMERKEIRRVGASRSMKLDLRFIAASSRDLRDLARDGRFLPELLNRLNVFQIRMPALREMPGAIPLLARFYVGFHARVMHKTIRSISPAALETLCRASWPGNIRQLRNAMEAAVIRCRGSEIQPHELPEDLLPETSGHPMTMPEAIREIGRRARRRMIRDALSRHDGQVARAAEELGVSRQALRQWIRELRL